MNQPKAMQGFTLIELMIVVLIISIIAGIAYPSYVNSMQKTRRADAIGTLQQLGRQQEEYFIRNRSYAVDFQALGLGNVTKVDTEQEFYDVVLTSGPAGCNGTTMICTEYSFSATPNTDAGQPTMQSKDTDCQTISIDNRGWQSAKNSNATDSTEKCWH